MRPDPGGRDRTTWLPGNSARGVPSGRIGLLPVRIGSGAAANLVLTGTYACSLEEITQMLHVLLEPAATIVAAVSFTGARKGELRGFRWEDFDGEQIRISQSYWRNHV